MTTINIPYETQELKVTKNNIDNFTRMQNPRALKQQNVNSIYSALLRGDHFGSPIIVNVIGSEKRIIDGNHRVEAMRKLFAKTNEERFSIPVTVFTYRNLSPSQELEVFSIYNSGKSQTTKDWLEVNQSEISFVRLAKQEGFPCKLSFHNRENSVLYIDIVNIVLNCKKQFGTKNVTKENIVEFAKSNILREDYLWLRDFFKLFIASFGNVGSKNIYSKKAILVSLANIYYINKRNISDADFERMYRHVIGDPQVMSWSKNLGSDIIHDMRAKIVSLMNKGRSKVRVM